MKIEKDLETEKDEMIIEVAEYLIGVAKSDPMVAATLDKPNKSLKELGVYLVSEAQKVYNKKVTGGIGIKNETVFGWAQHYYDEDDIKVSEVKQTPIKEAKTPTPKPKARVKHIKDNTPDEQMSIFDL